MAESAPIDSGPECSGVGDSEPQPKWIGRLDSIATGCREDGWDSYGADAVTDDALNAALAICRSLDVVPTVNGGVQISFLAESVQVEVNASGQMFNVYIDMDDAKETLSRSVKKEFGRA